MSNEVLAKLILEALRKDSPSAHIDTFGVDDRLVIDGRFDLLNVAQLLAVALFPITS